MVAVGAVAAGLGAAAVAAEVAAAAAHAGDGAACAEFHNVASNDKNLTSCRAGIFRLRVGDDFPRR